MADYSKLYGSGAKQAPKATALDDLLVRQVYDSFGGAGASAASQLTKGRPGEQASDEPSGDAPPLPETDRSIISKLGRAAGGGLAAAGNILDLPGSSVRDVLTLNNPFDQWLAPTSSENRTSGRDMLRQYGVAGEEDTWGNFGAGVGAEILLDPLTFTGIGAFTKAGQAASKATFKTAAGVERNLAQTSKEAANTLADRAAKKQGKVMGKEMGGVGARMRMTPRQLILGRGTLAEQIAAEKAFYAAGGTKEMFDQPIQSLLSFRIPGLMKEAKELKSLDPEKSMDDFVNENAVMPPPGTNPSPIPPATPPPGQTPPPGPPAPPQAPPPGPPGPTPLPVPSAVPPTPPIGPSTPPPAPTPPVAPPTAPITPPLPPASTVPPVPPASVPSPAIAPTSPVVPSVPSAATVPPSTPVAFAPVLFKDGKFNSKLTNESFSSISPAHENYNLKLDWFESKKLLNPGDRLFIQTALADSDMRFVPDFKPAKVHNDSFGYASAEAGRGDTSAGWKQRGEGSRSAPYELGLNFPDGRIPQSHVLLHETGHLAFYRLKSEDPELFGAAFTQIRAMVDDGTMAKFFDDTVPSKGIAQHLESNPHEFMAQMFANKTVGKAVAKMQGPVAKLFSAAWAHVMTWVDKFVTGSKGYADDGRIKSMEDLMEYVGGYAPKGDRDRILELMKSAKQVASDTPVGSVPVPAPASLAPTMPTAIPLKAAYAAFTKLTQARQVGVGVLTATDAFWAAAGISANRMNAIDLPTNEATWASTIYDIFGDLHKKQVMAKSGVPMPKDWQSPIAADLKEAYEGYFETVKQNDFNKAARKQPAEAAIGGASETVTQYMGDAAQPEITVGYHGTHHDFEQFDRRSAHKHTRNLKADRLESLGVWFTDNQDTASTLYGPKVQQVDIPTLKPFVIHESSPGDSFKKLETLRDKKGGTEALRDWLLENKYDSVVLKNARIDGVQQDVTISLADQLGSGKRVFDADNPSETVTQYLKMPSLGTALASTAAGAKALGASAMAVKDNWMKSLPDDLAAAVGDTLDKGTDLWYKVPGAAELTAIFNPKVMGALTGEGRDIGEQRHEAIQSAIIGYREAILPLLKSINASGSLDEAFLVKGGLTKDNAIKAINENNNKILNFIERGEMLPVGLQSIEPQLVQVRKLLDDAYEFERASGLDVKYLDDEFNSYFPRHLRRPSKTFSFNATTGGVLDTKFAGLKSREYRDMPGGTAVLNEMSLDPNLSSVATRDPVIRQKLKDGDLKDLRVYVANTYGPELFDSKKFDPATFDPDKDTLFDAIINDFASQDPHYVDTQSPMFGRNVLQDLSRRLEDGKRSSHTALAAQELIAKNLQPVAVATTAYKNQKNAAAAAGQAEPLIPLLQLVEGNKALGDMALTSSQAWENVITRMDSTAIAARDKMLDSDAKTLLADLVNGQTTRYMDGQQVKLAIDPATGQVAVTRKEMVRGSATPVDKVTLMPVNIDTAKELTRQSTNREFLGGYGVTKGVMDEASRWMKPFTSPDEVTNISNAMRRFMNVWRTGQTALWPAFHFRNLLSGQVQNAMFGAFDPNAKGYMKFFRPLHDAHKLANGGELDDLVTLPGYAGLTPRQATEKLRDEIFIRGGIGDKIGLASEYLGDAASALESQYPGMSPFFPAAPPGTSAWDQWNPLAMKDGVSISPSGVKHYNDDLSGWARAGRGGSSMVEFYNRVAPYIAYRRQGFSSKAAMDKVNKIQVDYTNLSATERKIRNFIPFYTFSSRNLPTALEELVTNPGGPMGQTVRVINKARDEDANIPDHIAATAAIPFGTKSDGSNSYFTGFGLAFEDALNLANGPLRGNVTESLREVAGRSNPIAKATVENMFGRSLFFDGPGGGRELETLDPNLGRTRDNLLQMLTGEATEGQSKPLLGSNALEQIVANSPFARAATTARTLTDARKWERPTDLIMNLGTGMRVNDVSPAAQDSVYRARLAEAIKAMGGRTYSRPYFSDATEGSMTPEQLAQGQQMMDQLKVIDKRFKQRREEADIGKGGASIRDSVKKN